MKTFFEKLFLQFETVAHPADGSWIKTNGTLRKRKTSNQVPLAMLSPECYNVRGLSKKAGDVRRTPAP